MNDMIRYELPDDIKRENSPSWGVAFPDHFTEADKEWFLRVTSKVFDEATKTAYYLGQDSEKESLKP